MAAIKKAESNINATKDIDIPESAQIIDSAKNDANSNPVKGGGVAKSNRNIFLVLRAFVISVIDELKKVITPTRDQLIEYIIVVLVFVTVIMLFITGVDVVIGQLVMGLFAK